MIDLTRKKDSMLRLNKGASRKFALQIGKKDYIFKENYYDNIKKKHLQVDLIEVFSSYFLKKTGCKNFVKYNFAKCDDIYGCISESFVDKNVTNILNLFDILLLNYANEQNQTKFPIDTSFDREFGNKFYEQDLPYDYSYFYSIETICEPIKKFCENYGINFSYEKLEKRLKEIVVYDFFMCNVDRNWQNLDFLISKIDGKETMELSPIFDNGECFGMEKLDEKIDFDNLNIFTHIGISNIGCEQSFDYSNLYKNGGWLAVDIYELAKKDAFVNNLVEKCKNVDIEKMLEEFEEKNDILISEQAKQNIAGFYNYRLNQYNKTVERYNKKTHQENSPQK